MVTFFQHTRISDESGQVIEDIYHCVTTHQLAVQKAQNYCDENSQNIASAECAGKHVTPAWMQNEPTKPHDCFPFLQQSHILSPYNQTETLVERCSCCSDM